MVCFKEVKWTRRNIRNDWWKLRILGGRKKDKMRILDHKKIRYPMNVTSARLSLLWIRYKLGLINYTTCKRGELLIFIQQRRLDQTHPGRLHKESKAVILATLQEADGKQTFPRFMSLPPELRLRVYTLHFESFATLDEPVQPPISQVSNLVRKESLPLFYQTCTFLLDLATYRMPKPTTSLTMSTLPPKQQTSGYFHTIPEAHLGEIRNLLVQAPMYRDSGFIYGTTTGINYGMWSVGLQPKSLLVTYVPRRIGDPQPQHERVVAALTQKFQDAITAMGGEDRRVNLTRENLVEIRAVFPTGLEGL